ncbi:MAG: DUF1836 domain-containing protein [Oscillospiraceae bacterium]
MDQLISYMPRQLIHYGEGEALTSAMVNNYIKDGALPRADGKRYSRTHLAYLTAICALKQVLSGEGRGRRCWPPPGRGGARRALRASSGGAGPGPGRNGGLPGRGDRRGGSAPAGPGPRPCAAMPTKLACERVLEILRRHASAPGRQARKRPEGRIDRDERPVCVNTGGI